MAIPEIIHQTYKSGDVPPEFEKYRDGMLRLNPGWEYRFYDDSACRDAVERVFPAFLPIYDGVSAIQRTDIFRVVIVYGEGGFYIDMDVECLAPLDTLAGFRCVFGEELTLSTEEARRLGQGDALRVANYMFGSEPGHPFLLEILRRMAEGLPREIITENDVLESTGPGLVTTVYHESKDDFRDVVLLRNPDRTCPVIGAVSCHFGNYARHHHGASWRWEHGGGALRPPARPRSSPSEADVLEARRAVEAEAAKIHIPDSIYILKTYGVAPFDGLSAVHDRMRPIGKGIDDSRFVSGGKVLVCGMPFLFTHLLSGANKNAVYTTFETDRIPGRWVKTLNSHYRLSVVPHEYVKGAFESSGVRIPVEVVQQGYTRHIRTFKRNPGEGVFRIGFLGVPYARKNLFKLYQACVNLRGRIPGLRLAVHSVMLHPDLCTVNNTLIEHSPFVEWTSGTLDLRETSEWYDSLSCYVFPSSGEGWSFTPRESLYMGVPTVLSDIPVHRELAESGFCRVIPSAGREDSDYAGKIHGQWDRIETGDIEEAVWDVYSSYGAWLMKAIRGARWIENRWLNEDSQQRVLGLMRSL